MLKKSVPESRLVVIEQLYQQSAGKQPVSVVTRFSRSSKSTDQPYIRQSKIGEEWEEVDKGWLDSISFLHLSNDEGHNLRRVLTPTQSLDLNSRIIELSLSPPTEHPTQGTLLFPPGESYRLCPGTGCHLYIRCRKGVAAYTLMIFP